MGVAMVPRTAVALQHPDVRIISLGSAAPLRRVLLTQRVGKVYSRAGGRLPFHPARNARERARSDRQPAVYPRAASPGIPSRISKDAFVLTGEPSVVTWSSVRKSAVIASQVMRVFT